MPQSEVRIIVVAPTSSDTWAPCRTRLYTSRPNSSVPRKFAALGGFRRWAGSRRRGSWVEITLARSAARITTARIEAPTAMFRLRTACRRHVGRAGASAAATAVVAAPSAITDPRVDEDVEHVHHQIDEHVRRRGDEDHALHDRVVPAQHRTDDQPAEPGNGEHDLGHHGAADQDRHRDPDDRDDRPERIAGGL